MTKPLPPASERNSSGRLLLGRSGCCSPAGGRAAAEEELERVDCRRRRRPRAAPVSMVAAWIETTAGIDRLGEVGEARAGCAAATARRPPGSAESGVSGAVSPGAVSRRPPARTMPKTTAPRTSRSGDEVPTAGRCSWPLSVSFRCSRFSADSAGSDEASALPRADCREANGSSPTPSVPNLAPAAAPAGRLPRWLRALWTVEASATRAATLRRPACPADRRRKWACSPLFLFGHGERRRRPERGHGDERTEPSTRSWWPSSSRSPRRRLRAGARRVQGRGAAADPRPRRRAASASSDCEHVSQAGLGPARRGRLRDAAATCWRSARPGSTASSTGRATTPASPAGWRG